MDGRAPTALAIAVLALAGAAGCLGTADDPAGPGPEGQAAPSGAPAGNGTGATLPAYPNLSLSADGSLRVDVPVDVVTIGFEDGVAENLSEELGTLQVDQASQVWTQPRVPPNPENPKPPSPFLGPFETAPLPIDLNATYRVHAASEDLQAALADRMEEARLEDNRSAYEAAEVEDWLNRTLPERGVEVDPHRPVLVLLHGAHGDVGIAEYGWRYTYPNGWLQPVRAFGGDSPVVVLDVAARSDPYVMRQHECFQADPFCEDRDPEPYDRPLEPGGSGTVKALAEATRDATRVRLLQGAQTPIGTTECHAVTVVLGIRSTALTTLHPDVEDAHKLLHPERVEGVFDNLTAPLETHVDVKVLELPAEDPELASLTRGVTNFVQPTVDALRSYLDENWRDYWVAHEGCTPYLSLVIQGDAADQPAAFALYNATEHRRIALGIEPGLWRTFAEAGDRPPGAGAYDFVDGVIAHETGHVLGIQHPSVAIRADGTAETAEGFASLHTVMSHQATGGRAQRTIDFSAVDRANWHRNLAGFLVEDAVQANRTDAPAFREAMVHLDAHEWGQATVDLSRLANPQR